MVALRPDTPMERQQAATSDCSASFSQENYREGSSSSASTSRNNVHLPFKRYNASVNGLQKDQYSEKGDWVRLVLKRKELSSRTTRPSGTEKGNRSLGIALLYAIGILVVLCYFAADAFMQGSIGLIFQGTSLVASEALTLNTVHCLSGKALSSEEILEYKVKFVPSKLKERSIKQRMALDKQRLEYRRPIRQPRLAVVFKDLEATPEYLYLITMWKALASLGYELQVFSLRDGPTHVVWEQRGAIVNILQQDLPEGALDVDWLLFEGILLCSLVGKSVMASFLLEPFKEVRVIWILHENSWRKEPLLSGLASQNGILSSYERAFKRANVVLLSDYSLAMRYSQFDAGNFFVLPGSPIPEFEAAELMSKHSREEVRAVFNLSTHDVAVAVLGSPFSYKSVWREHARVMQAILPLAKILEKDGVSTRLMIWNEGSTSNYSRVLQTIATKIGIASTSVQHFGINADLDKVLWSADAVVYSSLREEQAFPSILVKAMVFDRPIIAPNITFIREHIQDNIQGYIFEAWNDTDLALAFERALSRFKGIRHAQTTMIHSNLYGKGLFVVNVISEFAELLEGVLEFPSGVQLPLPVSFLSDGLQGDWLWPLLKTNRPYSADRDPNNTSFRSRLAATHQKTNYIKSPESKSAKNYYDDLTIDDWAELGVMKLVEEMEQSEEEQLMERNEQLHSTWEEVYRSARKAENAKIELHEREDGELERTGQPICIYEPYMGLGTWPSLGEKSILYRGISLIGKERRPGSDDIEAPLRLPLLNNSYYRDVLNEFGAFLAIANRIDRVHKNAWIGFQSWQAAGRKVSLTSNAELLLQEALENGTNGNTVYFWASTEVYGKEGSLDRDFWPFCDAINNNQCRQVFLRAFKELFGLPANWNLLPPMPTNGDRWSSLNSWAMPTASFLEFIMFSRMFVSSLDSLFADNDGKCGLGVSTLEIKHCYSRLLELLVNVWMYHSGRRMVFLNPINGSMHEQHSLSSRRGFMWLNFFSYETLKQMDAELAEEADDGITTNKRWLWPQTGEVFCQQISDREHKKRYMMKLEKKKRDKERVRRIRSRQRQRPLAKG